MDNPEQLFPDHPVPVPPETNSEWGTPQALFDRLHQEFRFDIDVCATDENAKLPRYYTRADDGLLQPWAPHRCFMNPPYGAECGTWVAKAVEEARRGAVVVAVLQAATDVAWYHDLVLPNAEIRFIRGRLYYNDGPNSAPWPSMIAIFRRRPLLPIFSRRVSSYRARLG